MQCAEVHGNVPRALAQLNEQEENEYSMLKEIIQRSTTENTFFTDYGNAMLRNPARSIAGKWHDRNCEIDVVINGERFSAKGRYEKNINALIGLGGFGLGGLTRPTSETWVVEYEGALRGSAIQATLYTYKEEDQVTLLSRVSGGSQIFLNRKGDSPALPGWQ